ncbi:hypothetical protein Tco_1548013 [Tanacetum coccineum]
MVWEVVIRVLHYLEIAFKKKMSSLGSHSASSIPDLYEVQKVSFDFFIMKSLPSEWSEGGRIMLHGRKTGWSDLVCTIGGGRRQCDMSGHHRSNRLLLNTLLREAGASELRCPLVNKGGRKRSRALNHKIFQFSNDRRYYRAGLFSKTLPPAAELQKSMTLNIKSIVKMYQVGEVAEIHGCGHARRRSLESIPTSPNDSSQLVLKLEQQIASCTLGGSLEQFCHSSDYRHPYSFGRFNKIRELVDVKIQQKRDNSHLNLRRQARDDALRDWEAQIDQLRRQEHEVSECKMVHTPKNDAHQKKTRQIERISSLPEKPNPGSLTIPCSVDIFNINAIADLGASVNIMFASMLEELSLADPKKANIIVEMADKTWCVSQGIIENVLASYGPYYEICDGGGIPDKKLKHFWKSRNDDDRITLEWEGLSCTNWLGGKIRERTLMKEQEDPKKCGETKERAIIRAVVNKLPEEWFFEVSRDKDDLKGIINYLEPTLYEGFIDHNNEAYKQRRNKLIGIPYTEPPPIKKEEAEITKYNLGVGEVFTKTKILNIKEFLRTSANIANIRAEIIEDRNSSSEDLSNTKRRHWCKPIFQWKKDICTKWASCNPHFDECDGGDNPRENKEYWESNNDDIRTILEWESLSFDNWVRVAFGKVCNMTKRRIYKDYWRNEGQEKLENEET